MRKETAWELKVGDRVEWVGAPVKDDRPQGIIEAVDATGFDIRWVGSSREWREHVHFASEGYLVDIERSDKNV